MTLLPLPDAVRKISAKTPVGSVLRSREWSRMPLALRERGQFSAGVESIRLLQSLQDRLSGEVSLLRERLDSGKEATFDRSSFIDSIRSLGRDLGLTPTDEAKIGGLLDITSIPRLGMIYDIQKSQAQEFSRWKMDQTEGALMLYPAQRLVRIEDRMAPRDWERRWAEAGSKVGWEDALPGQMVALKTSPIWSALSRFGTPWPPFDFNSGMGLEDVDRDEAIALGLITEETQVEPIEEDFNAKLEASAEGLSPELRDQLKAQFGDQIDVSGDRVRWNNPGGAQ